MANYSQISAQRLLTCDQKLVKVFSIAIGGFDHKILCGHRTIAEQKDLYVEGKTQTLNSRHLDLPSKAVDAIPYPINWDTRNIENLMRFYYFAGYIKGIAQELNIKIRWGGDWNENNIFSDNKFDDLVHYELMI